MAHREHETDLDDREFSVRRQLREQRDREEDREHWQRDDRSYDLRRTSEPVEKRKRRRGSD